MRNAGSQYGEFLPHVVELVQRQLGQYGRVGATRIIKTPDVPAIAAVGGTSQPQQVNWRDRGVVIAMYGQELAGTAAKYASTRVKVQVGSNEDLFTDGQAPAFVSMLALFGGAQNWFPLIRWVEPGVVWLVTYENRHATDTATPETEFAFIAEPDVQRMLRDAAKR